MGEAEGAREDFRATHALRDALPTRRHAEMLFAMTVDLLGPEAWVETCNDGTARTLFRREAPGSSWIVPWPLLHVARGGPGGPGPVLNVATGEIVQPKQRPGRAPRLRDLGPGRVELFDGPHRVDLAYGEDGRWFECCRSHSPEAHLGVLAVLAHRSLPPVEGVASYLAGLDLARHGPGRVHLPVPLPGGVQTVWNRGLSSLRDALFREIIPRSARWVVVDGWLGTALARGATREAAMDAWRDEVVRLRPFPPKPEPPADPPPEPGIEHFGDGSSFGFRATVVGPRSDLPWVEPSEGIAPAAALSLGPLPPGETPFGGWTRLLNPFGATIPAALRLDREGFTLVGDRLLDHLDPATLEDRLAEADADAMPPMELPPEFRALGAPLPKADHRLSIYRLVDESTGAPVRPIASARSWHRGYRADHLDGDTLRWTVARLRREEG